MNQPHRHLTVLPQALLTAFMVFNCVAACAHHSFAAEFDIKKPVELHGTVTKVELINPHSWIHIQVTAKDGSTESWMIEGGSPNQLLRKGFTKNSVPVGAELVVIGYQARDGGNRAVGRSLKLANGEPLFFENTPIPEADH